MARRCRGRGATPTTGGSFQRAAGAYVVMVDGAAVLYVDRGGGSIQLFPAADDPEVVPPDSGAAGARRGRTGPGAGAGEDRRRAGRGVAHKQGLLDAGFVPGYRGLVLRSPALDRRAANGPFPPDPSTRRSGGPDQRSPDARVIRMGRG